MNKLWLTVPLTLLLLGCQANDEPIQAFISQAYTEAKANVEPLPEPFVFVADEFVMTSHRIPFVRPRPEQQDREEGSNKDCWQPDLQRTRTSLENYPLGQLTMKGVLGDDSLLWALIYTPEGKLVKIREGHYLGLNHGKVQRVSSRSIEIEETLPDGVGCWLTRPMKLTLTQP